MENYADRGPRKTSHIITIHNSSSPLFLRLLAELPELPDTEERVVSVVTLLRPLLLERKLKPDLPLWKEWVLLFLKRLPPLLEELTFLWARLWLLLSLSVRLSDMEEEVVVLDLPIFSLLFLSISLSLWVTVGCLTAVVWCLLRVTSPSPAPAPPLISGDAGQTAGGHPGNNNCSARLDRLRAGCCHVYLSVRPLAWHSTVVP